MTKVSVFGQQPTETKDLKKIEFVKWLNVCDRTCKVQESGLCNQASNWEEVCLLVKKYQRSEYDLIFARGVIDGEFRTCIYLGHWNDGVV
jgi:hypothetical protein